MASCHFSLCNARASNRHTHTKRTDAKNRPDVRDGQYLCIWATFRRCETICSHGGINYPTWKAEGVKEQVSHREREQGNTALVLHILQPDLARPLTWLPPPVPGLDDGVVHGRRRLLLLLLIFVVGLILLLDSKAVGAIL